MVHTLSTRVPVIGVLNWRKKISAPKWYFPKLIIFMASFLGQCFLADECILPQKYVLSSFPLDINLPNVFLTVAAWARCLTNPRCFFLLQSEDHIWFGAFITCSREMMLALGWAPWSSGPLRQHKRLHDRLCTGKRLYTYLVQNPEGISYPGPLKVKPNSPRQHRRVKNAHCAARLRGFKSYCGSTVYYVGATGQVTSPFCLSFQMCKIVVLIVPAS